jgi:hypothetical protein
VRRKEIIPVSVPAGRLKRTGEGLRLESGAELDSKLKSGILSGHGAPPKSLRTKGDKIVEDRPRAFRNKLERKLALLRMVTEQATAVIEVSPDAENNLNAALLRLIQQHLFRMLVDLKTQDLGQEDIGKIAETVAQMTRATVLHQKWASEIKLKLAERVGNAKRELRAEAKRAAKSGGGMSPDTERRIRRILTGITE